MQLTAETLRQWAVTGKMMGDSRYEKIRKLLGRFVYDDVREVIDELEGMRSDEWVSIGSIEIAEKK